jgi:NAD(P)-dependent dehydrogenase (short-subunit alcohol dehydrogenase family)
MGPGQCIAIPADLQKLEEINRLVAELSKREDRKVYIYTMAIILEYSFSNFFFLIDLDVLVNNAGANWNELVDTYPDSAFEKVVNLNLKRIFSLTQA